MTLTAALQIRNSPLIGYLIKVKADGKNGQLKVQVSNSAWFNKRIHSLKMRENSTFLIGQQLCVAETQIGVRPCFG